MTTDPGRPVPVVRMNPGRMKTYHWLLGTLFVILLVIVVLPSLTSFSGLIFQLAAIGLAIVGSLFGFLVLRRLNLRLDRLAGVAQSIGAGDLTTRSDDQGSDAVSRLAHSINQMAEQIQVSIHEGDAQRAALADREKQLAEQNGALLAEHQRRASFGEFLTAINTVDMETITHRGLSFVATLADAQLAVFYLWDETTAKLHKAAETGLDGQALLQLVNTAPESGMPIEVLRQRSWIRLSNVDVELLPALELGFGTTRIREVTGIPVLFQKEALGVIVLAAMRTLDEHQREVVGNAVEALGGAVNNAQTYKTVQRQALRLESANHELLKADRLRSEFVANMSHELRTPLNSVIGFSHLLSQNRSNTLSEADLKFVEKINRNGKHLLGLINDILDLSKIEAGRMELDLQPTVLASLVTDVSDMLQPQVADRRLQFQVTMPESLPSLQLDAEKLKQVLINLLGNAVKFTEEGRVSLRVEYHQDGKLVMHVEDTGIGIRPDRLAAIFEPFRQADTGTTREFGGTGLGLSISRALVELMQGQLEVYSAEGQGTRFSLRLPVSPVEPSGGAPLVAMQASRPAGVDASAAGLVLVVDQQPGSEPLLERIRALGARAHAAGSAEEALHFARSGRPQLILLAVMLTGRDGWQILTELKTDPDTSQIPVAMISSMMERRRAISLGAADMLTNPVKDADLKRLLIQYAGVEMEAPCLLVAGSGQGDSGEQYTRWLGRPPRELRQLDLGLPMTASSACDVDAIILEQDLSEDQVQALLRRIRQQVEWQKVPVAVLRASNPPDSLRDAALSAGAAVIRMGGEQPARQLRRMLAGA